MQSRSPPRRCGKPQARPRQNRLARGMSLQTEPVTIATAVRVGRHRKHLLAVRAEMERGGRIPRTCTTDELSVWSILQLNSFGFNEDPASPLMVRSGAKPPVYVHSSPSCRTISASVGLHSVAMLLRGRVFKKVLGLKLISTRFRRTSSAPSGLSGARGSPVCLAHEVCRSH